MINNIQCISESRLSPYMLLCKGDKLEAICVYTALQHRSALYFTIIQEIEIAFRNELSSKIEIWLKNSLSSPTTDLYDFFKNHMLMYLSKEGQKQLQKALSDVQLNYSNKLQKTITKARQKALKKGLPEPIAQDISNKVNPPNHNDIISHLTFGFWVYLLEQDKQKNPNYQFWANIFEDLFEGRFSTNLNLFTRMKDVLRFRNNLYHQEAVWKGANINTPLKALQNLETKFNNFLEHLNKLSPYRFALVEKSYHLNKMKSQLFDHQAFTSELAELKSLLEINRI
ncbi:Abi-like protein [Cricetibacter osteomyelitidis]|uniref:Abi-like protein n=1 Tax=Cricetibacter osteomyelitidis TaxID=1521931 RepID=A0A4R2SYC7_9PAST|nr:Abi family protein [Cricetibacter osteomyelitidis]TCP95517.1 Abi-like protein [Cricetibacter osteomyelitidis]